MNAKNSEINVIGAGGWGKNIVNTLYNMNALASVTELNPVIRAQFEDQLAKIPIYDSVEKMLTESAGPVAIATPVNTHFALAKQALQEGRDVFVEKPMAISSQHCRALMELAKSQDKVLMVGHMLLFQPAIQFIKHYLSSAKLGRIYSLRQVRRNLGKVRTFENALYSLGVHDLAVLSYLIDEPFTKIMAVGQAVLNKDIEDEVCLHIEYPSGIQAHLNVNWLWPHKERHLTILCEKGALVFDELNQQVVLYNNYATKEGELINNGSQILFEGAAEPLKIEMQHFIDCVENRKEPLSSAKQGEDVISIIEVVQSQLSKASQEVYDVA